MIKISVEFDIQKFNAQLFELRTQVLETAARNALNATAQIVKADLKKEMQSVFNKPTPYTLNSLYMKAASRNSLVASVGLKDGAEYLYPQVMGGGRRLKNFERALRSRGLLPAGWFAVPGSAAKLDQYGNMSRGQLMQVLSALNVAEMTSGYLANRLQKMQGRKKGIQPQFFVGCPGGRPLGVWQRFGFTHGSAVKPILIFVSKVSYRPRFRFHEVGIETVKRQFAIQYQKALREARRSS